MPIELIELSQRQNGVVTRAQLLNMGFNAHLTRRRIESGSWQEVTSNVVALHNLPITRLTKVWAAGLHHPKLALTGAAALELYGLKPEYGMRIHLVGPRGTRSKPLPECVIHTSETEFEVLGNPPRTTMPVTVAHAMKWAKTDKQAAFYACTQIQNRRLTLPDLEAATTVLLQQKLDLKLAQRLKLLIPGADSIPELEFALMCRQRGFPEPRRQVPRKDSNGRNRYVDCEFIIRNRQLVVEIDGMGHLMAEVLIDDGWRANELLIQGTPVLRISSLALKLNPEPFFEQLQILFEKAA